MAHMEVRPNEHAWNAESLTTPAKFFPELFTSPPGETVEQFGRKSAGARAVEDRKLCHAFGRRHGSGDGRRDAATHLRAVLHHQGAREGARTRPGASDAV